MSRSNTVLAVKKLWRMEPRRCDSQQKRRREASRGLGLALLNRSRCSSRPRLSPPQLSSSDDSQRQQIKQYLA
ncbi:hypothetical protein AALP_AA5G215100 [Arabis alpina]|uniref:Uncharacterized protein n=1 Tax=Arabis alpina TaxID=50452 RepID=A0A087GYJ8_ARAAL|nr:hypothetical protein AALP_AA5G215100 [Arabis alpina]